MSDFSNFLCCDWGTSSFRLRLFSPKSGIKKEYLSADGISTVAGNHGAETRASLLRNCLTKAVEELLEGMDTLAAGTPILCSGMLSSSIGWKELPYSRLPFAINGKSAEIRQIDTINSSNTASGEFPVYLISGVASNNDVMRGEEVQLIGILSDEDYRDFSKDCLIVLPGTHSKHNLIKDQTLISFQSYMSGELYKVIASNTILRHSIGEEIELIKSDESKNWFVRGIEETQDTSATAVLFRVRACALLEGLSRSAAASYLSGILIGAELRDIAKYSSPILLAAGEELESSYSLGLNTLGYKFSSIPPEILRQATCRGQIRVYQQLDH